MTPSRVPSNLSTTALAGPWGPGGAAAGTGTGWGVGAASAASRVWEPANKSARAAVAALHFGYAMGAIYDVIAGPETAIGLSPFWRIAIDQAVAGITASVRPSAASAVAVMWRALRP